MIRLLRAALFAGPLLATTPVAIEAQTADQLLRQGIAAYRDLNYGESFRLINAALDIERGQGLETAQRLVALSYVGAIHTFANRRADAEATFRRMLLVDPRHEPDRLIFPPQVLAVFEDVRRDTKGVSVVVAPEAELAFPHDSLAVRLYVTSLHDVDARLTTERGDSVHSFFHGPIRDSLVLQWSGRGRGADSVDAGTYYLVVTSHGDADEPLGVVQVPLYVEWASGDTLPHPPRPEAELLPERTAVRPALEIVLPAAVGAAAAIVLPTIVADGDGLAGRFAISIGLGGIGLGALFAQPPGRPIPANREANRPILDAWRREVQATIEANEVRRSTTRLVIRAGAPVRREGGG